MAAFFAFLHHLAAFTLVATLAVEFVLLRGNLDLPTIRKLSVVDAVFGASAGLLLVVGLLRVYYFEKGAAYYFHSIPFLIKLALFVIVGLLSIYPTVQFISWRKGAQVPMVSPEKLRRIRSIVHWELAGVLVIILCAALMARGIGFLG